MKELSIEDKAKRYDEALERAKVVNKGTEDYNIVTTIFPELKESEDEKIKKWIRKELECKYVVDNIVNNEMADKAFVWLEKQGEQDEECKEINLVEILKHYPKETEMFSPLYGKLWLAEVDEKNEIITCYKHHLEKGCTRAVLEQEDSVSFYSNGTTGLPDFSISKNCMLFLYDKEKQGENKPTDKVEPKFKVGDIIRHKEQKFTCKIIAVDTEYRLSECNRTHLPFDSQDAYELVEQKPTWSKKDENCLGDALWAIEQARTIAKNEIDMGNLWFAENWLKSLKERMKGE